MSCKYSLLFLFFCGFGTLTVSEKFETELREGTSYTIKLPTKTDSSNEIKWIHLSSGHLIHWKNGKIKSNTLAETMEKDGSLTFKSVSLKNNGKYKYTVFNQDGTEIGSGEKEIKVYAKAPKPTVTINCKDGNVTLTCETGDHKDLTVSWYKEGKIILKKTKLFLTFTEEQENKQYSCNVSNPVSSDQSDSIRVSCSTSKLSGLDKLFGFDFWIMVSILAGGGALLLLLICVLVICACRSCSQRKKHEQDEDEFRLKVFQDEAPNGTARSKHTARGQPVPPIPQEDPSPQTPTQSQTQPKAQIRARPPPPPEDDEEYPPPLPHPRNKQHRKINEEPYRPME